MRSISLSSLCGKFAKKIFTKLTVAESLLDMHVLSFKNQNGIHLLRS